MPMLLSLILIAAFVIFQKGVYVLKEYERGVVLRFGKFAKILPPGLQIVLPFIDQVTRIDQRTVTLDVPTQDVITRDNVSIKVNAVLYFRVMDPARALIQVENYLFATSQIAQTTLRSVCGEAELDQLLAQRDELNKRIQEIVDAHTDPWGIKVSSVEIKDIDLPQEMQRAMAKQAEAERERRAKVIQADGEFQASEKLTQAAEVMARQGIAVQLRYLETLRDIASEKNSTIVFPIPLDFMDMLKGRLAPKG